MSIMVYCDGSIEGGNPGGHGVGGYIIKGVYAGDGVDPLEDIKGTVDLGQHPTMTNNVAEYSAVVAALEELVNMEDIGYPLSIKIHCDSKLVVEQCKDLWRCNNDRLSKLRDKIWFYCDAFTCPVEFVWIPREDNTEADEVSRSLYGKEI